MTKGPLAGAALLAALALAPACSRGTPAASAAAADTTSPPDSLALRLADGGEIWLGEGRAASDALGRGCRERTLQIIRGGRRTVVPLLYTGDPPVSAGDSAVRVRLWLNCQPGDWYRVDVRTGQPYREGK